jgi:putative hemolysin
MTDEIATRRQAYPSSLDELPSRELREGRYQLRFARSWEDLDSILRLRFEVFNLEMGEGLEESIEHGRDLDLFDPVCHHLMVIEVSTRKTVGTYRLQTCSMANQNHGFYSDVEFDLSGLGKEILDQSLELGRACVAKAHRSTQVLFLLWKGLATYVATNRKRYLFGCSSLTSQDPQDAKSLERYLHRYDHFHPSIRVCARPGFECYSQGFSERTHRSIKVPPLFRAYLRHGAKVCSDAAIDREFKTIDFLILFDIDAMDQKIFDTFFG